MKLTEVCPAGRTTVAGTVSCVGSLETSCSVKLAAGAALAVIVPVIVPANSWALLGRLIVSVAVSLSCTRIVAVVPLASQDAEVAVIVTVSGPSTSPSSTIVIGSGIEVCPAGMVRLAGTAARLVSLEARLTTRSVFKAAAMLSVPLTVPSPLVALLGSVSDKGTGTTLKILLALTCPAPSSTCMYMPLSVCGTVTLPLQTPLTNVAVVAEMGTGVESPTWAPISTAHQSSPSLVVGNASPAA